MHLTLPVDDAVSFALGFSDLHVAQPSDLLRQIVGILTLEELEYFEQWNAAATLRTCLADRWPRLRGTQPPTAPRLVRRTSR